MSRKKISHLSNTQNTELVQICLAKRRCYSTFRNLLISNEFIPCKDPAPMFLLMAEEQVEEEESINSVVIVKINIILSPVSWLTPRSHLFQGERPVLN